MKKNKTIIKISLFIISLIILSRVVIYISDKSTTQKLNENILNIMQDSEIIKKNLGIVKNINTDISVTFEKYDNKGSLYANYNIILDNNDEYDIKIIVNPNFTKSIYAYEIDGKLIYANNEESIENN